MKSIIKICNNCGKTFKITPHDIELGRTSNGNRRSYVECPYCDNPQYPYDNIISIENQMLIKHRKGGIIGKVYIKEMPNDYNVSLKIGEK